jgi:hypothetical protein
MFGISIQNATPTCVRGHLGQSEDPLALTNGNVSKPQPGGMFGGSKQDQGATNRIYAGGNPATLDAWRPFWEKLSTFLYPLVTIFSATMARRPANTV